MTFKFLPHDLFQCLESTNTYILKPAAESYIHTYRSYILTYLHTYWLTYIHTYILTYIHTYIHTYLHTGHTYILTYIIHTYILTYIHTYRSYILKPAAESYRFAYFCLTFQYTSGTKGLIFRFQLLLWTLSVHFWTGFTCDKSWVILSYCERLNCASKVADHCLKQIYCEKELVNNANH